MTVLQVMYIGHASFYETRFAKKLEMANESIYVLIQYCFVLLINLVTPLDIRDTIGYIAIALVALLFTINMAFIIYVSVKALLRKIELRFMRQRYLKNLKTLQIWRA